ncbi:CYFA0S21e00628g1_1 [Cyberlindnera fabianii]|uniref:CYFA0S21e00628g1_1 n=1 Tax=Cyberlindnera fabianii TaxID=36022 RepID=A0A061B7W6_CYBFA|nr:CYFA0S21e00628g1_1 [Cyberlindnera fabianii]
MTPTTRIFVDRIEKVVLEATVRLIAIPPPTKEPNPRDGLYDVSAWNFQRVCFKGKLQFIEEEYTDDRDEPLVARIVLRSHDSPPDDGPIYGETLCDPQGENVKQTHSRRAFRVLFHELGKTIALGIVFDESSLAGEFVSAIRDFKRNYWETREAQKELEEDIEQGVTNLNIASETNTTSSSSSEGSSSSPANDDDDEFGDFVGNK